MHRQNSNDLNNVIKIQSVIRGSQTRDKYQMNELPRAALENYPTFVVGNDPQMPPELNNYIQPDDKIALVATSGMRAVSLACKLGNSKQLPKIILVDNSSQVVEFWKAMRSFVQDDTKAGTKELFLENLPLFLQKNRCLYRELDAKAFENSCTDKVKYLSQDISIYFKALIDKYDYKYIKDIISHAYIIQQSWADIEVFAKIKNILNYLGISKIFMYPSNIVSCIGNESVQNQVLQNIESLTPILSIHTNLCNENFHSRPERVLLITNQDQAAVRLALFQPHTCIANTKQSNINVTNFSLGELIELISIMQNSSNVTLSFSK